MVIYTRQWYMTFNVAVPLRFHIPVRVWQSCWVIVAKGIGAQTWLLMHGSAPDYWLRFFDFRTPWDLSLASQIHKGSPNFCNMSISDMTRVPCESMQSQPSLHEGTVLRFPWPQITQQSVIPSRVYLTSRSYTRQFHENVNLNFFFQFDCIITKI